VERDSSERVVTKLFESWYQPAVRYGFHSCGSIELAEEFAQEAFAALYRELRRGSTIASPRAWILHTIQNQICKHWRSRRRHPEELLSNSDLESRAAANGALVDSSPSEPRLVDFLALLTQREEEAILLRAKGMKYREIASQMGVSTNTIGTLIMRAVRKIRQARERAKARESVAVGH